MNDTEQFIELMGEPTEEELKEIRNMLMKKPQPPVEEVLDVDGGRLLYLPPQGIINANSMNYPDRVGLMWVETNKGHPLSNHALYLHSGYDWVIVEENGSKYLVPLKQED